MKVVYKYEVPWCEAIDMPSGAKILSVHGQHNKVCLWALVDPNSPHIHRRFKVFGTGHPIENDLAERLSFVGTVHLEDVALVLHVFEELPPKNPDDF